MTILPDMHADRSDDVDRPPSASSRWTPRLLPAALGLAIVAAAWLVVDPLVARWRLPERLFNGEDTRYWDRLAELADGVRQRQWAIVAVALVALGLAVVAMWQQPHRRRRIANAIGVAAVLGFVTAMAVHLFVTESNPGEVTAQVWITVGVALLGAVVATLWSREMGSSAPPPRSRASTVVTAIGAGCALFAAPAAFGWVSDLPACGEPSSTWQDALAGIGMIGGLAAVVLGIAMTVMRRWFAGLVVMVIGGLSVVVTLIGALQCLS